MASLMWSNLFLFYYFSLFINRSTHNELEKNRWEIPTTKHTKREKEAESHVNLFLRDVTLVTTPQRPCVSFLEFSTQTFDKFLFGVEHCCVLILMLCVRPLFLVYVVWRTHAKCALRSLVAGQVALFPFWVIGLFSSLSSREKSPDVVVVASCDVDRGQRKSVQERKEKKISFGRLKQSFLEGVKWALHILTIEA